MKFVDLENGRCRIQNTKNLKIDERFEMVQIWHLVDDECELCFEPKNWQDRIFIEVDLSKVEKNIKELLKWQYNDMKKDYFAAAGYKAYFNSKELVSELVNYFNDEIEKQKSI